MEIIYPFHNERVSNSPSIFLAGPTPRNPQDLSWRPAALYYLNHLGFDGRIYVPEPAPGMGWDWDYEDQIEWEEEHLIKATRIIFWIPRTHDKMPGYTTNIEFGRWCVFGKIIVGWPKDAFKMRYIAYYVKKLKIPSAHTLYDTLKLSLNYL